MLHAIMKAVSGKRFNRSPFLSLTLSRLKSANICANRRQLTVRGRQFISYECILASKWVNRRKKSEKVGDRQHLRIAQSVARRITHICHCRDHLKPIKLTRSDFQSVDMPGRLAQHGTNLHQVWVFFWSVAFALPYHSTILLLCSCRLNLPIPVSN